MVANTRTGFAEDASGIDVALSDRRSLSARYLVGSDGGGTLLGAAKIGANHSGPSARVATASFIVAASARRLGVGRALEAVPVPARLEGFEATQFNAVASINVAAMELYRSEGFRIVGRIPQALRHPALGDIALLVMQRKLRSRARPHDGSSTGQASK